MAGERILVVDDEPAVVRIVSAYLEREGYQVERAGDGETALAAAHHFKPDLVVLDLMLPGMDGLEICCRLRENGDPYVLVLTARGEEFDKVVGLSTGADDYVTKPFSAHELVARVRAILRRGHRASAPLPELTFPDFSVDLKRRRVTAGEHVVELTPREFDVLSLLVEYPERVFGREEILGHIWGADFYGDNRVVDVHIAQIRRKLMEAGMSPDVIRTVRGVGYAFSPKTPDARVYSSWEQ